MKCSAVTLAALALVASSTWAFTIPTQQNAAARGTRLYSSATPVKTSASTDAAELEPEYHAAQQQALAMLEQQMEANGVSPALLDPLNHFLKEYLGAAQVAYAQHGNDECSPETTVKRFLQGIQYGVTFGMGEDRYMFGASHKALRGNPEEEDGNTVDYYKFGCDFFRPCMNLDESLCLGQENLKQAFDQVAKGENVVFLANHQSEADPQVFSVMLEQAGFGKQAENVLYIAGHKVTTDPLAIPFSMGRNLVCIHSKKHIDSDPDTKPVKQRQNLAAMGAMLNQLKAGGTAIWVAPSGGRDRRDLETGKVPIAPFDSKTIDMFRLMGNKSKKPTHYYPLAMVTYDLCPPPDHVEASVGEERNVRFVPVGIACGKELVSEGGLEKRHEFCENAESACEADYQTLLKKLHKDNMM